MRHFYYFILTLLFLLTACTPSHTLTLTSQSEAVSWTRKLNNEPLQQTLIVPKEGLSEIELLLALPSSEGRAASAPDLVQLGINNPSVCHPELCCGSGVCGPEIHSKAQDDKLKTSAGKLLPSCTSESSFALGDCGEPFGGIA